MKALAAVFAVLLSCSAAAAQDTKGKAFFEWVCVKASKADLRDLEFASEKGGRINNLSIKEDKDFLTDAPTLKLSASAANRSDQKGAFSLELVGLAGQTPAFSISARPAFGMVPPQENQELTAYIYAPRGTLAKADTFCVRGAGYLARN